MEQEVKTTNENQDVQTQDTAQTTPESDSAAVSAPEQQANATPDAVEIARLRAEITRLTTKADNLASENANQKKELRSYKSAEQIREEERKEAEAAKDARLKELEKKIAISEIAKDFMSVTKDDSRASMVAEWLHGAEDAHSVVLEVKKLLDEQEKRLKIEYGKIPAPSAGGADGPMYTKEQLLKMKAVDITKFANEHPDQYNLIMGR